MTILSILLVPIVSITGISIYLQTLIMQVLIMSIVGPIVEEIFKYIAIKNKAGSEFLLVFNVFEFSQYVLIMTKVFGVGLLSSIFIRLLAIVMHYSTARNIEIGIQSKDEVKEKNRLIGSMFLHSAYNSIAQIIFSLNAF